MVYHVLNRGLGRMTLFYEHADYRAFLRVVGETLRLAPMRICGYCLMPNHGHFLLWSDHVNQPRTDGEFEAIQRAIRCGAPLGSPTWVDATARRMGLESTFRPRGFPKQPADNAIQDS